MSKKRLHIAHKIRVMESSIHGWGVFATDFIKAGELIEEAPICTISRIDNNPYGDVLDDYRFLWPTTPPHSEFVMGMGYSAIYNHSDNPNANWVGDLEKRALVFRAIRDIQIGEEICTNYGSAYTFKWK